MRNCCDRNASGSIKQYNTIEILCKYKDNDGLPLSLAGINIKSDMHTANSQHIDTLNISILDVEGGVFIMTPNIDKLPVGVISIDVLFEKDGKRITSDTFTIDVDIAITKP